MRDTAGNRAVTMGGGNLAFALHKPLLCKAKVLRLLMLTIIRSCLDCDIE